MTTALRPVHAINIGGEMETNEERGGGWMGRERGRFNFIHTRKQQR